MSVLLIKNGVPPGTTAIFSFKVPMGTTKASLLANVD